MLEEYGEIDTKEKCAARLAVIEAQLLQRHNLKTREDLLKGLRSEEVVEDELVADWHCEYSCLLDWTQNT